MNGTSKGRVPCGPLKYGSFPHLSFFEASTGLCCTSRLSFLAFLHNSRHIYDPLLPLISTGPVHKPIISTVSGESETWGMGDLAVHPLGLRRWQSDTITPLCFVRKHRNKMEDVKWWCDGIQQQVKTSLCLLLHTAMWAMWGISLCDLLPSQRKHHPSWPVWAPV